MTGALILAAIDRHDIANYVAALFRVYSLLILAYIILSLVFAFGRMPYSRILNGLYAFLRDVSEPLLRPFRRILPSFGGFDFSPILAILALNLVGQIIVSVIAG
jgi:YggT family protein